MYQIIIIYLFYILQNPYCYVEYNKRASELLTDSQGHQREARPGQSRTSPGLARLFTSVDDNDDDEDDDDDDDDDAMRGGGGHRQSRSHTR